MSDEMNDRDHTDAEVFEALTRIVAGGIPDDLRTEEGVRETLERMAEAGLVCRGEKEGEFSLTEAGKEIAKAYTEQLLSEPPPRIDAFTNIHSILASTYANSEEEITDEELADAFDFAKSVIEAEHQRLAAALEEKLSDEWVPNLALAIRKGLL